MGSPQPPSEADRPAVALGALVPLGRPGWVEAGRHLLAGLELAVHPGPDPVLAPVRHQRVAVGLATGPSRGSRSDRAGSLPRASHHGTAVQAASAGLRCVRGTRWVPAGHGQAPDTRIARRAPRCAHRVLPRPSERRSADRAPQGWAPAAGNRDPGGLGAGNDNDRDATCSRASARVQRRPRRTRRTPGRDRCGRRRRRRDSRRLPPSVGRRADAPRPRRGAPLPPPQAAPDIHPGKQCFCDIGRPGCADHEAGAKAHPCGHSVATTHSQKNVRQRHDEHIANRDDTGDHDVDGHDVDGRDVGHNNLGLEHHPDHADHAGTTAGQTTTGASG